VLFSLERREKKRGAVGRLGVRDAVRLLGRWALGNGESALCPFGFVGFCIVVWKERQRKRTSVFCRKADRKARARDVVGTTLEDGLPEMSRAHSFLSILWL
jgi:hypothetical protein